MYAPILADRVLRAVASISADRFCDQASRFTGRLSIAIDAVSESVKMVGTGKSSEFVSVYTAAPS
jgi:hypothetical protein